MKSTVTLDAKKERPILLGHPWVFPKAIHKQKGSPQAGDLVLVYTANNTLLGTGIWNPFSLYRLRMLAYATESFSQESLEDIVAHRLHQAKRLRHTLQLPHSIPIALEDANSIFKCDKSELGVPGGERYLPFVASADLLRAPPSEPEYHSPKSRILNGEWYRTTAYRFFNSEGDGLSGLTIDIYDHVAVVSSTAYWVQLHRGLIETLLKNTLPITHIVWNAHKKSLSQEGWDSVDIISPTPPEVIVYEAGVQYHINFEKMQKTGLFLDQRDNHERIAHLAQGKRVLDLYCYTGGFALHAAKAGAAHVTAIDSSKEAIRLAEKNAQLNQVSINWICADVTQQLALAADYDIVILDPPKLVPSRHHVAKATKMYRYLNREVLKVMPAGALLLTCNCSSAMSWDLFMMMLAESAQEAGRRLRCLGKFGASGDHPVWLSFLEGEYLRAAMVEVL